MSDAQAAPDHRERLHFSGIAGAGMNPLAQLMRAWGHAVQGSDRSFDQGQQADLRRRLESQGIRILPQDGTAIHAALDRVVYSAAVEPDTPELIRARELKLACVARPALLAEVVAAGNPGVAVAGTSGKSTVSGMIHWILLRAGVAHTFLGGAPLAAGAGAMGGFQAGPHGAPVVAEACESDGTLVGYHPGVGLVHNLARDHGEVADLRAQFLRFAAQSKRLLVNAGCAEATALATGHPAAVHYGGGGGLGGELALDVVAIGPERALGVLRPATTSPGEPAEILLDLPQPGAHTLDNAVAACVAARALGIPLADSARHLREFPGIFRRFEVIGTTDTGIRVVDDYAHNGEKIRAAVAAAQAGCDRLLAVFQPHGFGPARFLRPELRTLIPEILRPQDRWCYAPIFYAGGTVAKDLSSRDLCDDLPPRLRAGCADDHAGVLRWCAETAIPNDTVLLMGARDPALPRLARAIHDLL